MQITLADGSKGTATVEQGKHGGMTLVIRRGFPIAAEVVAGLKLEHVTASLVGALVAAEDVSAVVELAR